MTTTATKTDHPGRDLGDRRRSLQRQLRGRARRRLASSAAASGRSTRSSSRRRRASSSRARSHVESIDVDDENIRPHLLSPEFFDVGAQPEHRVPLDRRSPAPPTNSPSRGELTMAGSPLPVEATGALRGPVTDPEGGERSRSPSRPRSTAPSTAWAGRWSCRTASRCSATTSSLIVELELVEGVTRCASSPSPAASAPTPTTRACSATRRSGRLRASRSRSATAWAIPPYDADDDTEPAPPPVARAPRAHRRRRRPALRDARIQLVDPGRPQERDRLGFAPARETPSRASPPP